MELKPRSRPLSLIDVPACAKRDSDLGLALTLGDRPGNYFHLVWLSADHYFNKKNELDGSFYRRDPSQLTVGSVWFWVERYKLRLSWQDNDYLDTWVPDISKVRIETRLRTGWELYSIDKTSALTVVLSFNLDEIASDVFVGGPMWLRAQI